MCCRFIFLFLWCFPSFLLAQNGDGIYSKNTASDTGRIASKFLSLEPASSFDKRRFWISAGTGTAVYSGFSVALWNAWYKDFPLTEFHTFDDMAEWKGMDKSGHLFSTWMEANLVFHGALWTGMDRRKAAWTGVGVGMGLQSTVEIMDGFSEEWGFSWGDVAFNVLGAAAFMGQEMAWEEQRIVFKVSGRRPAYSTEPVFSVDGRHSTTLDERAAYLYGISAPEVILKDYNALTIWASANVSSFLPQVEQKGFFGCLNVALGFGANNLYGGFENQWEEEEGVVFLLDENAYPRYHQFYLSPDIDLTRIPTRSRWLKFALGILNVFKIPAPAMEVNTLGKVRFHPLHW